MERFRVGGIFGWSWAQQRFLPVVRSQPLCASVVCIETTGAFLDDLSPALWQMASPRGRYWEPSQPAPRLPLGTKALAKA